MNIAVATISFQTLLRILEDSSLAKIQKTHSFSFLRERFHNSLLSSFRFFFIFFHKPMEVTGNSLSLLSTHDSFLNCLYSLILITVSCRSKHSNSNARGTISRLHTRLRTQAIDKRSSLRLVPEHSRFKSIFIQLLLSLTPKYEFSI